MRLKKIPAMFFFIMFIANVYGINDTIILNSEIYAEKIAEDLDSLVNSWYVRIAIQDSQIYFENDSIGLEYPDSVYMARLSRINSVIKLPYNSIIRNHIHVYTVRQREKFRAVLGLKDYYFPIIEDIFDSYNLPTELKFMSVIESALNPNAYNRRSGATGMWQFMYSTGKLYGLAINSLVDERRDPVKSTHAAAKYIRDLYNIYNDWILVIAAYNCGPGNVNKAIKRSGNKKDYWDIYTRLPRETRGYIPMFVAAAYAVNYFPEHKLAPLPLNIPVSTDTIMISQDIHLNQISEVMRIPLGELKALNPQYKTGLVPGSSSPQSLTLPMSHLSDFIGLTDTIRNFKPDVYLTRINLNANPSSATAFVPPDVKGKTKLIYTVKDGDNLGFIAEWYRVGLSDLRYWNDINRNLIRAGQKLVVYVDPQKADYYSGINEMTFAEKQQMIGKSTTPNAPPVSYASLSAMDQQGEFITYTVRNGDTIWDIVKRFDNVSASDVITLNNLTDPGKIRVGQVLKIKKKS